MKKRQLYDDKGDFYPITHSEAVLTPSGKTVEEVLNEHKVDFERELRGGGQANIDPFKDMGAFATPADFNAALNSAFASTDGTLQGHLRYICQGQVVWADQIALDFSRGKWMQVVYGVYKPSANGASLVYDYQKYHVAYRWATTDNPSALWQDALTDKVFATINGNRIDQGGNLEIGGGSGGGDVVIDDALDGASHHAIQNAAVYDALYGANGVANAIRNLQQAMTAGKVVMVDGWGALPSNPTEGMVAFSEGKIKTYTNSLWGNGEEPDPSALYVKKNVNIVYRWDADNEEMYPLVGQEIDDAWVLNSSRPVQSKVLAKRFKKLEIAMFGTEQGNSDETSITNDSLAKDMEDMKDAVFGEVQSGTRSGGLNTTVTDMKEALYGQGGTAQAPAQGSISQKVSNLETEAIKGIKVNGASIEKDQQGIANITVKATGSSYTAQVKSDWTGEDKRTSKLTNFEWSEDTDDAILVVDPNTKELWLGYCSDKDSDPRTYIYFQEWIDCGPIPSSDTLAANGTTIQYKLGGISHTASYSTSTHKVTELIIGEGATLKAQTKSDWTGETKSDHKLTNFEWSEDADDAILVVDTTNNELWLGYSDMPDTPRTYVYYKEWNQCGSIPASDIIAEKGQLVQYVSDNVTYLATYNATTHRVVPTGGGSSDAIAQIDNSSKPVQSGVLKQRFDDLENSIEGIETGVDFSTFDYTKGNPGIFTIDKKPEDITVNDVETAYKVNPFGGFVFSDDPIIRQRQRNVVSYTVNEETISNDYLVDIQGVLYLTGPKSVDSVDEVAAWESVYGSLSQTPHLWTASEIGLGSDGNTNITKIKNALGTLQSPNPTCIGFYLDAVYNVNIQYDGTKVHGVSSIVTYFDSSINIPKDFIISGAAGGTTKGGFSCNYFLFYTEYSLILHKFSFIKTDKEYYSFGINVERGIDQLQVIDSSFTTTGVSKGRYFYVYSPNTRPYKLYPNELVNSWGQIPRQNGKQVREVADYNYLNHLYISGNAFEGAEGFEALNLRLVKSARFVKNKFTYITSSAIKFGCQNTDSQFISRGVVYDEFELFETIDKKVKLIDLEPSRGSNERFWFDAYKYKVNIKKITNEASNVQYFAQTKVCMSCPIYVAGNSFEGKYLSGLTGTKATYNGVPEVRIDMKHSGDYVTAMLAEAKAVYFLYNEVKDIVCGQFAYPTTEKTYYTDGSGNYLAYADIPAADKSSKPISRESYDDDDVTKYRYYSSDWKRDSGGNLVPASLGCEAYDTYLSCAAVYYTNNRIKNIIYFSKATNSDGNKGITKTKNTNTGGLHGGLPYFECVRYFKGNTYTLDTALMKKAWKYHCEERNDYSGTYSFKGGYNSVTITIQNTCATDYNALLTEKEIGDSSIPVDGKVLSIGMASSVIGDKSGLSAAIFPVPGKDGNTYMTILKEYVFSNNVIDAGDGCIWGSGHNMETPSNSVEIVGNTFIGTRFCGDNWDDRNVYKKLYGSTADDAPKAYLFPIGLFSIPRYGSSVMKVYDNIFRDTSVESPDVDCDINFVCVRFYSSTNPTIVGNTKGYDCVSRPEGDISIIKNNKYEGSAAMYVKIDKREYGDKSVIVNMYREKFTPSEVNYEELQKKYNSLYSTVYGESTEGLPTVMPVLPNLPAVGSKYSLTVDGERVIRTIKSPAASFARLCFRIYLDGHYEDPAINPKAVGPQTVDLSTTAFKFAPGEENDTPLTLTQLQAVDPTLTSVSVTVSTTEQSKAALKTILVARGYTYKDYDTNSSLASGQFHFYHETNGSVYWLRIIPKTPYPSHAYVYSKELEPWAVEAQKLVTRADRTQYSAGYEFPTRPGSSPERSVEGAAISYEDIPVGGLNALVEELLDRVYQLEHPQ